MNRDGTTMGAPPPSDCGLFPEGTPAHQLMFRSSFALTLGALTLGFSLRTAGTRHMPMHGPALLVANHQSYLDPPLVGVAARRELVYLARKSLFSNRFFAGFIGFYNAVPIDQDGIGKDGIRTILAQLQRGRAVLVFPEGERTRTGAMQPFKGGIHLLIKRTEAAIVPVGIAGAYDAWPCWRPLPNPAPIFLPAGPGTIGVAIGPPEDARHYAELPRDRAMNELSARIDALRQQANTLRRKP
jgi:1-acyl-sn-glycerol-3-phosphate acyltransferase